MNSSRKASRSSRGASASRTARATSRGPMCPKWRYGESWLVASSSGWLRPSAYPRSRSRTNRASTRRASAGPPRTAATPPGGVVHVEPRHRLAGRGQAGRRRRGAPRRAGARLRVRLEKPRDERRQPRPDRARGVLLFGEQRRGHDDVGVDGPERHAQCRRRVLPPPLRLAQRVLVTHDQCRARVVAEPRDVMIGMTAKHEADAARREGPGDVRQAVGQEGIVTPVRVRVGRRQAEERHDRQPERVGRVNGDVERGIVRRALGALHPVDHGPAVGVGGTRTANRHAGRSEPVRRESS